MPGAAQGDPLQKEINLKEKLGKLAFAHIYLVDSAFPHMQSTLGAVFYRRPLQRVLVLETIPKLPTSICG